MTPTRILIVVSVQRNRTTGDQDNLSDDTDNIKLYSRLFVFSFFLFPLPLAGGLLSAAFRFGRLGEMASI